MTLCLVSATDSYAVTVSRTCALASCLDSALARNASANLLECAVTKSLDLKSPEINTCRKCGGSPLLRFHYFVCFLRFLFIGVYQCSSVVSPFALCFSPFSGGLLCHPSPNRNRITAAGTLPPMAAAAACLAGTTTHRSASITGSASSSFTLEAWMLKLSPPNSL